MSTLMPYHGLRGQVLSGTPTGQGGYAINEDLKDLSERIGPCNYTATRNPASTDNQSSSPPYFPGSRWFNTANSTEWLCTSSSTSTAIWIQTGVSSAGSVAYTNTANTFTAAPQVVQATNSASSGTAYTAELLPTYSQSGTAGSTDLLINRTETSLGSGSHNFIDLQVGGTSKAHVDHTGAASFSMLNLQLQDVSQLRIFRDSTNASSILNHSTSNNLYLANNAYYDGTNWQRYNTGAPTWLIAAGQSDEFQIYRTPSGSNPIGAYYSSTLLTLTNTGRLSATTIVENPVALTFGSTVSTDASTGNIFTFTATSNFTLANPTNPTDGQKVIWRITQDATGGRTISFGTAFDGGSAGLPTLSTAANKVDYIGAVYRASASKWDILPAALGY